MLLKVADGRELQRAQCECMLCMWNSAYLASTVEANFFADRILGGDRTQSDRAYQLLSDAASRKWIGIPVCSLHDVLPQHQVCLHWDLC